MERTVSTLVLVIVVVIGIGDVETQINGTAISYGPPAGEYGIYQLGALQNNSHNLIVGWRQYGDALLLRQKVVMPARVFSVVTTNVSYIPPLWSSRPRSITAIYALDQHGNGNGASANLTWGGVGMRGVVIRLKSQRNHGIKFLVEVYGR